MRIALVALFATLGCVSTPPENEWIVVFAGVRGKDWDLWNEV